MNLGKLLDEIEKHQELILSLSSFYLISKEDLIKLKELSNLNLCESAEDLQDSLTKISEILENLFPDVE